jgi:CDP-diacylglycerol pyrophosphatase
LTAVLPAGADRPRGPDVATSARRPALLALLLGIATVICAASLPRDTLWGVEATCILNYRATGSTFPCVQVNLEGGVERGYAVLRAPFRDTHLVTMPTARLSGIEAPQLRAANAPNYFADAWGARHFIQADLKRTMAWNDVGLAVNSRSTRSQDQLHIHVDCVQARVKAALAERLSAAPTDAWMEGGYSVYGQTYWIRRVDSPSLEGVNPFRLAAEIPALQARPELTTIAVVGVTDPEGGDGFMLLAGQSDPTLAARQSTAEDLLDHACRRFR